MLIEIILCVIAITPYIIIFLFFNHFPHIINTMSDINEFFNDVVDTPVEGVDQSNKRKKLKDLINEGKAELLAGKTAWTVGRIDKASDKVIDKLYSDCKKGVKFEKKPFDMNSIASKMMGVKDIKELTTDINKNPLIKGTISNVIATNSLMLTGSTPMEAIGGRLYAKCGNYLGFLALFCEIFTHLDWETFIKLANEIKDKEEDANNIINE